MTKSTKLPIDIGHGVTIEPVTTEGVVSGLAFCHPTIGSPGSRCQSWVPFAGRPYGDDYGWLVVSEEPLTLTPSLLCRTCGHHGHIRAGKWVPC